MRQLCEMYGCTKCWTTPYHPQGNGTCERFNQTLISLLATLDVEVQPVDLLYDVSPPQQRTTLEGGVCYHHWVS